MEILCPEAFRLWLIGNKQRFNYRPIEIVCRQGYSEFVFESITNAIRLTISAYGEVNLVVVDCNGNLIDYLAWLDVEPEKLPSGKWKCKNFIVDDGEEIKEYDNLYQLFSRDCFEEQVLLITNQILKRNHWLAYYSYKQNDHIDSVCIVDRLEIQNKVQDMIKYHPIKQDTD